MRGRTHSAASREDQGRETAPGWRQRASEADAAARCLAGVET